jgi:sodium-dependent phosphate cotransporter
MHSKSAVDAPAPPARDATWHTWLAVLLLVYLLLVGVAIIGDGFKWISGGAEGAERIFAFASNPIVGVLLGTLATALVQSSSTVTSVIVGLVAGGVPVELAVPMIMGANMGTTITNTIVSLGNLRERTAFNKSFQAATVHDFFNLYAIVIFLPIEILFRPLQRIAGALSTWFEGGATTSIDRFNFLGAITKPVADGAVNLFRPLPETLGAFAVILLGVGLVILSVLYLGTLLRAVMRGRAKRMVHRAIGGGRLSGISSGALITILVQSSSTTTSLVVPLAGSGVLSTRQVFPFTMGANIGTCVTALLAAMAITGPYQVFALQIALVHLFYNLFAVLLFSLVPWLRDLPVRTAEWLGDKTELNRAWAFGYIGVVFFMMPGAVFAGDWIFGSDRTFRAPVESGAPVGEEILENRLPIE